MKKSRVTFPQGFRKEAKDRGMGTITISVRGPNGDIMEELQVFAGPTTCHWAVWVSRLLGDENIKKLPDLERIYNEAYDNQ